MPLTSPGKDAGKPSDPDAIRERLKAARQTGGAGEEAVRSLRELAVDLLADHRLTDGMVLLVLDQLEEVFATPEGSEPRTMLRLLLEASADPTSRLAVLATMRSDFLNAFQLFEGAAERYEKITLDPMPRPRFAEVIEGPADAFRPSPRRGPCAASGGGYGLRRRPAAARLHAGEAL